MRIGRLHATIPVVVSALAAGGCAGMQSALDPAGIEAEAVARLFWFMAIGAGLIWLAVMAMLVHASRRGRPIYSEAAAGRVILWGGVVFPVVVLTLLLAYGLSLMPKLRPWNQSAAAEASLRIEVVGEQFWWRVVYHRQGREPVTSANEIRLPVGERVALTLTTADVIHAFWIPSLGGKMDMIPGRENTLTLQATRPGTFRAPCAEFCGTSHALMAFAAVAMEPTDFDAWLAREAQPSPGIRGGDTEQEGERAFMAAGCAACHRVDGTEATGAIGPDLSHLGSRVTLGAGILENTEQEIARFIAETDHVKPGVRMPAYRALPAEDIGAIASWLKGLQ